MKKIKILFILPVFAGGGQERVASRLSFALPDEFEKKLIVFYKYRVDYEFNGEIIFFNLPLPSLPTYWKILTKGKSLIKRILLTRKIKKEWQPDFCLSFGPEANIVNTFSNLFLKKKPKLILSVRTVEGVHF